MNAGAFVPDAGWINSYVGVPYVVNGRDRSGWDCWGLVLAVYRERLGIELPDWQRPAPFGLSAQLRAFGEAWHDVEAGARAEEIRAPEELAVVLVARNRWPHHVGVVAGRGILHAAMAEAGTVYDPLLRFLKRHSGVSWWRWRH